MTQQTTCRIASLNILWRPDALPQRLTHLAAELRRLNPDVLCLQEVADTNQNQLIDLLHSLGYLQHTPPTLKPANLDHWAMTFTKTPAVHHLLDTPSTPASTGVAVPTVVTVTKINDTPVHIINAHLAWGGRQAGYRLQQATIIAEYAHRKKMDTSIILAGDLNTTPESSTIRYLTGLESNLTGSGTLWLDAWQVTGAQPETAITNDPHTNTWARETCLRHDLDPDRSPQRRIDYILTHEWKYGGRGAPIIFGRFADTPDENGIYVSDHYGIWADIKL